MNLKESSIVWLFVLTEMLYSVNAAVISRSKQQHSTNAIVDHDQNVAQPKLNIFVPDYFVEMLYARYGTPYVVGMSHAFVNQIRSMLHKPLVFQQFIPDDYVDIFNVTFGDRLSSAGKYSFESDICNCTISFASKYEKNDTKALRSLQPLQMVWQNIRKSDDDKPDKFQIEIHIPKMESNEMVKTRAAYVGGYLAMKTILDVEEYILDMIFKDKV